MPPCAPDSRDNAMQAAVTEENAREGQHVCCICGRPVSPPYNLAGSRIYCDRHFALVNRPHDAFWRSAIVQIVAMGLFSLVVALLASYIGPIDDPWRVPVGL